MTFLPRDINKVYVPPVKCQGIKTKLVPFIAKNIDWDGKGKWVEPFLGSGVVVFNISPERAFLADTNQHIIKFYQKIQLGRINRHNVTERLYEMGMMLKEKGVDYYYEIRERFNREKDSFDFLFLNRSCFNGLMRFNSKGEFNVPFGHKPDRFARAYITKIANQVQNIASIISNKDWEFKVADWEKSLSYCKEGDFAYLDPPYIGRHADYYNSWDDVEAIRLAKAAENLNCEYALSMWLENRYRRNAHVDDHWINTRYITTDHFYHVGSTESLRNSVTEALIFRDRSTQHISV